MKAVMKVAEGPGHVELGEVPEPQVAAGQVLIEVAAAGICGTDLHIRDGEFAVRPPVVMGHELSGRVAAVGEGVTGVREGARVTSETYFSTCGRCRYCRDGRTNLCPERRSIGSAVNGAFTRYLVVPAGNRKSTRLNSVTPENLVCRLLLEKKKKKKAKKVINIKEIKKTKNKNTKQQK